MNRLLTIILIVVFALLLVFFTLWLFSLKPNEVPDNINPQITLVPTPTPKPTDLFIESSLPPQGSKEPYLTFQKITLKFSEEVNPIDVVYEISPPTQVVLRSGSTKNTVYILPREKWEIGTTTIAILQATRSTSGKSLYNPYIYKLVTDIPPAPELNEKHP